MAKRAYVSEAKRFYCLKINIFYCLKRNLLSLKLNKFVLKSKTLTVASAKISYCVKDNKYNIAFKAETPYCRKS